MSETETTYIEDEPGTPQAVEIILPELSESGLVGQITQAEIGAQMALARQYPRSIDEFQKTAMRLCAYDPDVAAQCVYKIPRGGKKIEGPSIRMAEAVVYSMQHVRAGSRVVDEQEKYVVAQGFFIDLERNNGIVREVRRRITDKDGQRFNDDMINVTGNAAASIALRNAVFNGIPELLWRPVYNAAKAAMVGSGGNFEARRDKIVGRLVELGATERGILSAIDRRGMADVTLEDLADLTAYGQALADGYPLEEIFPEPDGRQKRIEALRKKSVKTEQKPPSEPDMELDDADIPA